MKAPKNQFVKTFKANMTRKGHKLLSEQPVQYTRKNGKTVASAVLNYQLSHGFNKTYQYTAQNFWTVK